MPSSFDALSAVPPDPLLALIGEFAADTRAAKMDLGIGVYRDEAGITPVMRAVKGAEARLLDEQRTKSYLGPEGDRCFSELLMPLVCGAKLASSGRIGGVQTPGGTGALRLAAELIATLGPKPKLWMGVPTWPNHQPIFDGAHLAFMTYRAFDIETQQVRFDEMMGALGRAAPGDTVLLQVCCHNPTGADFTPAQWREIADVLERRGLLPLLDCAYHGLGESFEADVAGIEIVLSSVSEALIAYSCDKNFGLYRERTGALFFMAKNAGTLQTVRSNILALARANWSMPPDHGASAVRIILDNAELSRLWRAELDEMCARIAGIRGALAAEEPALAALAHQHGMFSMLAITPAAVQRLKSEHGIYMAGSGRVNLAGLKLADVKRFAEALRSVSP